MANLTYSSGSLFLSTETIPSSQACARLTDQQCLGGVQERLGEQLQMCGVDHANPIGHLWMHLFVAAAHDLAILKGRVSPQGLIQLLGVALVFERYLHQP